MSLMAAFAVSDNHFSAMWFVTLGTERNFTMLTVAETACQRRVLALYLFQLGNLLSMAGNTFISDVIRKGNHLWSMRVIVAPQAIDQIVVWFTSVALTAEWNNLFNCRRMAGVTVLAADFCFVCATIGSNCFRCFRVTFDAI